MNESNPNPAYLFDPSVDGACPFQSHVVAELVGLVGVAGHQVGAITAKVGTNAGIIGEQFHPVPRLQRAEVGGH